MHIHNDEWIITAAEIEAVLARTQCSQGPLAVLPSIPNQDAANSENTEPGQKPSSSDGSNSELLSACICVLANPERVVRMHSNVADSSVSRSIMATGAALPGVWVTITGSAEPFRISMRSDPELRFLVSDMLSAETTYSPSLISCGLSTEAALVLMACLDQSRRSWLVSLLKHLEPISIFSVEDINFCLSEGKIEDFRWTLPLVDKLLPIPIDEMAFRADPRPALMELVGAGLIETINEEANVFDWTEAGRVLAEGNRQAAARLVLSQSFLLQDDDIAHEIMLLTRTPLDVFLIMVSGADASLITMLPGDIDSLLEQVFVAPFAQNSEPETDDSEAAASESSAAVQAEPIAPSASSTAEAVPTKRFCTQCGEQLMAGAKFCLKCGTPVN
jgi:hypothetical protein